MEALFSTPVTDDARVPSVFTDGTVTAVSPNLVVELDGIGVVYPDSLFDVGSLSVDDRVRCELAARRVIVHGLAGGVSVYTQDQLNAGQLDTRYYTETEIDSMWHSPVRGVIPSSIVVGSGSASVASDGTITFTGVSSVSLNDVFDGLGADAYEVAAAFDLTASATPYLRVRASGVTAPSAYNWQWFRALAGAFAGTSYANDAGFGVAIAVTNASTQKISIELSNPGKVLSTSAIAKSTIRDTVSGAMSIYQTGLVHSTAAAYDGMTLIVGAGTMTGTLKVVKIA